MPITACFGVTFLKKIQFCMIARLFFTQNYYLCTPISAKGGLNERVKRDFQGNILPNDQAI